MSLSESTVREKKLGWRKVEGSKEEEENVGEKGKREGGRRKEGAVIELVSKRGKIHVLFEEILLRDDVICRR